MHEFLIKLVDDLNSRIDPATRDILVDPRYGPVALHHSLGRFVRNFYSLWDPKGRYARAFDLNYGLTHPDDMSGIILRALAAKLQGAKYAPEKDVEQYKAYWAKN